MDINKFLNISGAIIIALSISLFLAVPWLFIIGVIAYFVLEDIRK